MWRKGGGDFAFGNASFRTVGQSDVENGQAIGYFAAGVWQTAAGLRANAMRGKDRSARGRILDEEWT